LLICWLPPGDEVNLIYDAWGLTIRSRYCLTNCATAASMCWSIILPDYAFSSAISGQVQCPDTLDLSEGS
jgi:hypothetical protein